MSDPTSGNESVDASSAEFLREIRLRLSEASDRSLAARLAPALSSLTDRLVIVACDRLARADMTGFFETVLEGMSAEERSAWRKQLSEAWARAATARWRERRELRQEILETILFVKALALS